MSPGVSRYLDLRGGNTLEVGDASHETCRLELVLSDDATQMVVAPLDTDPQTLSSKRAK